MNADPASMRTRPYTQKEINHRNRTMSAYNIYSALFYQDFVNLDVNTKRRLMIKYQIKDLMEFMAADDDSIVSEPEAGAFEVMKIAAGEWNAMNSDLKNAWKDRCYAVNQLPVLGVFKMVPLNLVDGLNGHVIQSLTYEFDHFCSLMNQALKSNTWIPDTVKWKTFGKERFELGSKIFWSFYFNHLLKLRIFGDWSSFPNLNPCEVVYRSRMMKILHVSSLCRMEEIFTLNGVCTFVIRDNDRNHIYCCGGKLYVKEKSSGREGIGIVQDEDINGNITVLLEIGIRIKVKKTIYVEKDGTWEYNCCSHDEYTIIQHEPSRITRITKSGNCFFVMNKFILSTDDLNDIKSIIR